MIDSKKIHLWPERFSEQEGSIKVGFTFESSNGERIPLWYRLPSKYKSIITAGCEPFLLASLFNAMHTKSDIVVHGDVSPALLCNLEEFQVAWVLWYPNLYHRIDIFAETEREQFRPKTTAAITSFSGGVDSCFTVWRHKKGKAGRNSQNLRAGLIIHGADIPIGRVATFDRATVKAKVLLDSLNVELIPMGINLRKLGDNFAHSNAAILASCLMLLQGGFITGLIAGAQSYADLYFPWGSNPITDRLLSSGVFNIIYDSMDSPRNRKVREIAYWPEVNQYLRVCLGEDRSQRDKNCGRCEKCIRTILNYRALGLGLPPCFEQDASPSQIVKLGFREVKFPQYYTAILDDARASKITGSWIWAVQLMLLITEIRILLTRSSVIKRLYKSIRRHHENSS
jgi:hypothetical protein